MAVAVLLALAWGGGVGAQRVPPRVQPLLGVSTDPPSADATATLFDDRVLHTLRLTINSKDWATLKANYGINDYYPCDLRWRDQVVRNVGIRSRGTGSRNGVKPGLRVDFDRYTTGQRFLGLKSLVLRNNTQDASNLHERLTMLLFRRMDLDAPREVHAKLFVNEEYAGLFTIVESLDRSFLQRQFSEDSGDLYEYDYPLDQPPYHLEDRGADPAAYVPSPFKPETNELTHRPEYIARWIQTVNRASDAAFPTAVGEFLDLGRFLRYVAVEMFVGDNDGWLGEWGINNFYLYRFSGQSRFVLLPWDKSEAFKASVGFPVLHNVTDAAPDARNRLMARALSYPALYDTYLDALLAVRQSADQPAPDDARGWLERELEREYAQIRDAARADPVKPFTTGEFEQAVQDLRAFAQARGADVAAQVAALRR